MAASVHLTSSPSAVPVVSEEPESSWQVFSPEIGATVESDRGCDTSSLILSFWG